jgi:hypothetical protein
VPPAAGVLARRRAREELGRARLERVAARQKVRRPNVDDRVVALLAEALAEHADVEHAAAAPGRAADRARAVAAGGARGLAEVVRAERRERVRSSSGVVGVVRVGVRAVAAHHEARPLPFLRRALELDTARGELAVRVPPGHVPHEQVGRVGERQQGRVVQPAEPADLAARARRDPAGAVVSPAHVLERAARVVRAELARHVARDEEAADGHEVPIKRSVVVVVVRLRHRLPRAVLLRDRAEILERRASPHLHEPGARTHALLARLTLGAVPCPPQPRGHEALVLQHCPPRSADCSAKQHIPRQQPLRHVIADDVSSLNARHEHHVVCHSRPSSAPRSPRSFSRGLIII